MLETNKGQSDQNKKLNEESPKRFNTGNVRKHDRHVEKESCSCGSKAQVDSLTVELNSVKKEVSLLSTRLDEEKTRRQLMEQELKDIKEKLNFQNYMSTVPESVFESDKEEKVKGEDKNVDIKSNAEDTTDFKMEKERVRFDNYISLFKIYCVNYSKYSLFIFCLG